MLRERPGGLLGQAPKTLRGFRRCLEGLKISEGLGFRRGRGFRRFGEFKKFTGCTSVKRRRMVKWFTGSRGLEEFGGLRRLRGLRRFGMFKGFRGFNGLKVQKYKNG